MRAKESDLEPREQHSPGTIKTKRLHPRRENGCRGREERDLGARLLFLQLRENDSWLPNYFLIHTYCKALCEIARKSVKSVCEIGTEMLV